MLLAFRCLEQCLCTQPRGVFITLQNNYIVHHFCKRFSRRFLTESWLLLCNQLTNLLFCKLYTSNSVLDQRPLCSPNLKLNLPPFTHIFLKKNNVWNKKNGYYIISGTWPNNYFIRRYLVVCYVSIFSESWNNHVK